jgi:hypothetical protein
VYTGAYNSSLWCIYDVTIICIHHTILYQRGNSPGTIHHLTSAMRTLLIALLVSLLAVARCFTAIPKACSYRRATTSVKMAFGLFQQKTPKAIEKVTVQFMPSDTRVFADVGQPLSDVAEEGINRDILASIYLML